MTCWLCGFGTDVEERMCKNGPCQICMEVDKVNQEINQTMATLQRLIDKRRELHSEQNRAHDPMHRLPVELKNYIFQLLLPSHDEWGATVAATVVPSYLASVCREWRDFALSNPFLWSTMRVALRKSTPDPSNFVHNWILRSRTLPLTFHILVDHALVYHTKGSREILADVMSQCSNRMQSLSLVARPATLRDIGNDLQWHRLTQLRIRLPSFGYDQMSILNPTASPEKIDLHNLSLKSLQMSFERLSSAKLEGLPMEDIALLFQHASQMTQCHIASIRYSPFSMPSIIHHRLKTLSMHDSRDGYSRLSTLLGSLTLPCLQAFHTDEMALLEYLPAFVRRSSCPLTMLALFHDFEAYFVDSDFLQPLPGVADLIVDDIDEHQASLIEKLLLGEYFPDLRQLTLRLQPFRLLWDMGVISLYLDRKRPRTDGHSEGRFYKFIVVDPGEYSEFEDLWNSDVGEQVKALGISLREDGFEFL